jgi:S-adenosylmethionine synthetase
VNYEQIAREVVKEIGYDDEAKGLDYKSMSVLVNVEGQSEEIA